MEIMETVLKHHNQIELPHELCRKMDWMPGMRFEVEVDINHRTVTLVPVVLKLLQPNLERQEAQVHGSTDDEK